MQRFKSFTVSRVWFAHYNSSKCLCYCVLPVSLLAGAHVEHNYVEVVVLAQSLTFLVGLTGCLCTGPPGEKIPNPVKLFSRQL
jgi:hypothetical protein